jgi:hypothetical protein
MKSHDTNREIASFYYSFNGPQEIEFDTFIKSNKKLLKKIAAYEFDEWRLAIEQAESLDEVLCFLTINYGRQYPAMTATSTNARLHLLQVWEDKWGKLPTKWRVGFIRHSSFSTIQGIDLEILAYLFTQHRKFSSVIIHLASLQIRSDEEELFEDFLTVDELIGSLTLPASESDIEFDDATIVDLSSDTEIPLDWNIDDLDSDDILQIWDAEESY